ncbi:hypothetical protein ONS95_001849 [Cadophora gregata]|uniref:uncharacterized protein n=1 Tax=Cadophora gregata TaxID=51156 RepID=UPI0026DC8063|nr:uncharacterized protein ONS95_001849 [Cadophora gregata]KAK0111494.1 hypothetical protein ONS95_001849 [Cadophora gregata]KAK0112030.1 hypothetical protein ONS96_001291 [Cadophora gregata f. sp. sojae]
MFSKTNLLSAALAVGYLAVGTSAGAGAYVNGCVWYATKPITPFNVTFQVPTSVVHCMYDKGTNAQAVVTTDGLTCASVGHVSGKSSSSGGDTCATDDSRWGISYTAGSKSGTTYSTWSAPIFKSDHIDLYDQSPGTNICGSAAKCDASSIKIGSSGNDNVWIIFDPAASSKADVKDSEEL